MRIAERLQPYLFAVLAIAGLAGFAGYDLYREHDRSVQQARSNTANLARLLEANIQQSLARVLGLLADAQSHVGDVAYRPADLAAPALSADQQAALQAELAAKLPADGLVAQLAWLAPGGRMLASAARPGHAGLPAGGAPPAWLLAWQDAALDKPWFGPLQRDVEGAWLLPIGRRVAGQGGAAPQLLLALVDLRVLQPVFDAVDTGRNGFVTLFTRDGWLLATAPRNDALFARNWADTPMFRQHLPAAPTGTVQQVVVRDGTERVYSYRALADFPVVVSTGISMTDALADWRARRAWDIGLLGLVTLAALAGAQAMARTSRRRSAAEQAARDSARRTQAIVDAAADAILTCGPDGAIASINPAGEAMFGQPAHLLLGQPVTRLLPAGLDGTAAAAGSAGGHQALLAQRGDGSTFSVDVAVTTLAQDGRPLRLALVRDTTERQRAQAEVARARDDALRSERFLRAVTDNLPLRIAYLDRGLRYRFVNRQQELRFRRPQADILGRTREELTGRAASPALQAHLDAVLRGQAGHFELGDIAAGSTRVAEVFLVPDTDDAGTVQGFYAASADVTHRHVQQQRIERALAERDTLLREVYHRVKNNLQVVQSLLSLQRRALPDGPGRNALDESAARVYAMALVHEKLYQSGDLDAVALGDYVGDLLHHLGDTVGAARRGIVLQSDVVAMAAALEVAVPFGLLMTELVGNALKHAFPAGRGGCIQVSLSRGEQGVWLAVSDDGIGLPPGFDLPGQTSMGLQLACSLAAQLGGQLLAQPLPVGTRFSAELAQLVAGASGRTAAAAPQ